MIMRTVVYVILFICLFVQYSSTSSYILCTSRCSQITTSFLNPFKLPYECQDNAIDIYDYASVCIIDYRIDYDAKYIYINFKASNDTNIFQEYNQSEFLIQTMWLGFNEESGQPNITHRKYGCSTQSDCAREFYFNTIEHLVDYGQLLLENIKSRLYRQSLTKSQTAQRRCKNSNKTGNRSFVRCQDGLCYVNNINEKQYCTYDNSPTLFSEFEYYLPNNVANDIELIEYKCNRHLCNSNKMLETIKYMIRNYTNWYFVQKPEAKTEETLSTKTSATVRKTESFILIILFLIIYRLLS